MTERIWIGTWPVLTLHDAREKARSLLRSIELDRHVGKAPREEEHRMITLLEVVRQFIELYASQRTEDRMGSESLPLDFSSLFSRPIDQFKPADMVRILDTIIAGGAPTRANRALAAIKKLMNRFIEKELIMRHAPVGPQCARPNHLQYLGNLGSGRGT